MQRLFLLIAAAAPGLVLAQATPCVGESCAVNIPEPTTMALLAGGVAVAGIYRHITKKKGK
jgi:hypothetical protein